MKRFNLWYQNLKMTSKMLVGFVTVAVIAMIVGAVGIFNVLKIQDADEQLYQENTLGIQYCSEVLSNFEQLRYTALSLATQDSSGALDLVSEIEGFYSKTDAALQNFEGIIRSEDIRSLYNEIESDWNNYKAYITKVIQLIKSDQYSSAKNIILNDSDKTGDALQANLVKLLELDSSAASKRAEENGRNALRSVYISMATVVIAVTASIALGIAIARFINFPLNNLTKEANRLAIGDLDLDVSANSKDEIGNLVNALGAIVQSTREQAEVVKRLAAQDLTVDVKIRSDKDVFGRELAILVDNLNRLMAEIAAAADQVAAGSKQVSSSSMALSQGATQQASSVEELTASLEEMSDQTKKNAANAKTANELAANASSQAIQGDLQMQEMLQAMDEINTASSNINRIIKVIEDIAFQTNILALNAAVEAARAGQYGKGFAVVAEEVRTLAARSSSAAKETTELIENSIRKVG
ncbi:MAG: methyl-accepting chemotaxis protein, partial [Oscillospiraceae bacterium]